MIRKEYLVYPETIWQEYLQRVHAPKQYYVTEIKLFPLEQSRLFNILLAYFGPVSMSRIMAGKLSITAVSIVRAMFQGFKIQRLSSPSLLRK
jgi:hypothetical protein